MSSQNLGHSGQIVGTFCFHSESCIFNMSMVKFLTERLSLMISMAHLNMSQVAWKLKGNLVNTSIRLPDSKMSYCDLLCGWNNSIMALLFKKIVCYRKLSVYNGKQIIRRILTWHLRIIVCGIVFKRIGNKYFNVVWENVTEDLVSLND